MGGRVILETERLILREFDQGDAAAFYVLGSNPAIIRFTSDPGMTSLEQAREVLSSRPLSDYRKYGFGRWGCVHKECGEVIGFAGLKYLEELQEVDIGYRLLPAYWNVGLATEAGRAVVDYGFAHLHLKEIIGLADPENAASVRVLEKLGFSFDRIMAYQGSDVARYVIRAG